jgi:hypothetical protein
VNQAVLVEAKPLCLSFLFSFGFGGVSLAKSYQIHEGRDKFP